MKNKTIIHSKIIMNEIIPKKESAIKMIEVLNDDQKLIYYTIQDLFLDEEEQFEIQIEDYNLFYQNKETMENAKAHNFYGKYTLTLYDKNETSTYDFIYMEQYIDPWCDTIFKLLPVKLSDEKIFQYVDTGRFSFPEDTHLKMTMKYTPFIETLNKVKEDELLTFAGEIEKITDSHTYIHGEKYNTNFQVTDIDLEIPNEHFYFDDLCELDIENMKKDNYMGKIKTVHLNSIGMPLTTYYNITNVADEIITCEPCDIPLPLPNSLLPVTQDKHFIPVRGCILTSFDYIPYQNIHDDVCE